jgi:hypothetical protein
MADNPSVSQQILASFVESEVWSTNLIYTPKSIQDNSIVLVTAYMSTFNTRVEDGNHVQIKLILLNSIPKTKG